MEKKRERERAFVAWIKERGINLDDYDFDEKKQNLIVMRFLIERGEYKEKKTELYLMEQLGIASWEDRKKIFNFFSSLPSTKKEALKIISNIFEKIKEGNDEISEKEKIFFLFLIDSIESIEAKIDYLIHVSNSIINKFKNQEILKEIFEQINFFKNNRDLIIENWNKSLNVLLFPKKEQKYLEKLGMPGAWIEDKNEEQEHEEEDKNEEQEHEEDSIKNFVEGSIFHFNRINSEKEDCEFTEDKLEELFKEIFGFDDDDVDDSIKILKELGLESLLTLKLSKRERKALSELKLREDKDKYEDEKIKAFGKINLKKKVIYLIENLNKLIESDKGILIKKKEKWEKIKNFFDDKFLRNIIEFMKKWIIEIKGEVKESENNIVERDLIELIIFLNSLPKNNDNSYKVEEFYESQWFELLTEKLKELYGRYSRDEDEDMNLILL